MLTRRPPPALTERAVDELDIALEGVIRLCMAYGVPRDQAVAIAADRIREIYNCAEYDRPMVTPFHALSGRQH